VDFTAITTVWEKARAACRSIVRFPDGRGRRCNDVVATDGAPIQAMGGGSRQGQEISNMLGAFQWAVELALMRLGVGEEDVGMWPES
jgi:hypothetical protein